MEDQYYFKIVDSKAPWRYYPCVTVLRKPLSDLLLYGKWYALIAEIIYIKGNV